MKLTVSVTFATALILGVFSSLARADCSSICAHNGDPGAWDDKNSPAGELDELIGQGGGCYKATGAGYMCAAITGSDSDLRLVKICLAQVAADWQSYSRNWWLWSGISCSSGNSVGVVTNTHQVGN